MIVVCIGCGSELVTNGHRDQLCQECYEDQYIPSVRIKSARSEKPKLQKQRNERNYEARTRERKKKINRSTDRYISLI